MLLEKIHSIYYSPQAGVLKRCLWFVSLILVFMLISCETKAQCLSYPIEVDTVKTKIDCKGYRGGVDFFHKVSLRSVRLISLETDSLMLTFSSFNSSLFIINATIKGETDFYQTNFNQLGRFWHNQFEGPVFSTETNFKGNVDFKNSRFYDIVDFDKSQFLKSTEFRDVTFDSLADFTGVNFAERTVFQSVKFKHDVDFKKVSFEGQTNFNAVDFMRQSTFSEAQVNDKLDFSYSHLGQKLVFDGSIINHLDFTNAYLPDTLSLRDITIKKQIDLHKFRTSDKYSKCVIDLRGTPTDKVRMRYDQFRLLIPDNVEAGASYDEMVNTFEGLLKSFKDHGYLSNYERLDKEYQVFKYTHGSKKAFLGNVLNVINRIWSDYGYDKSLIWSNTFNIFLLFSFINWLRLPQLVKSVYTIPSIDRAIDRHKYIRVFRLKHKTYPAVNIFSPLLAIYYTGLIFFGLKIDTKEMNFTRPLSVAWIFFQYVVGLICVAYLANFVITSGLIGN